MLPVWEANDDLLLTAGPASAASDSRCGRPARRLPRWDMAPLETCPHGAARSTIGELARNLIDGGRPSLPWEKDGVRKRSNASARSAWPDYTNGPERPADQLLWHHNFRRRRQLLRMLTTLVPGHELTGHCIRLPGQGESLVFDRLT